MASSPGSFSYPPPGSNLQYNYIDSVVASWVSFDSNATDCLLFLYYWPGHDPWTMAFNQSAPANGTSISPLNFAGGSYLGQFNIFYTDSNGGREKFVSSIFNVNNSPQSKAVTWSQAVHAHSTSSASANLQTSISESLVTFSESPATASASLQNTISVFLTPSSALPATATASSKSIPVSKSPSTNGSALGTGSIAAIVMGVILCAGLAATLVIYRLKKPKLVTAEVRTPPVPANFLAEKDGSPSGRNEFLGDGQLFEMAGSNRVGTNNTELDGREIRLVELDWSPRSVCVNYAQ